MRKICENEKCGKKFSLKHKSKKTKFCCFDCYVENKKTTKVYPGTFKKGKRPVNYIRIGKVILKREVKLIGKPLFNFIKTGNQKYYRYDKYVWEKHYKIKLSRGLILKHIDGNNLNDDIQNLEVVTSFGNKTFKKCTICNKEFRAKKNHKQIYCSKKCANEGHKSVLIKICKNESCLTKEFKPKNKTQEYCCKKCIYSGNTIKQGEVTIRKIGRNKFNFLKLLNKKLIRYDKYVFEKHYNKKLNIGEIIKHIDGNNLNDDIQNLEVVNTYGNKTIINKCSNPNCNKDFVKNKIRSKYCCRECCKHQLLNLQAKVIKFIHKNKKFHTFLIFLFFCTIYNK